MNEGLDIGRAGHGYVAAGNALLWLTFAMLAAGTLLALVPIRDRARAPRSTIGSTGVVAA